MALLDTLETPALLVDLDAFEANVIAMAERARAASVRLRPHAKTHKSPFVAAKQMQHGAVGVCCQTVDEAQAMVAAGIADVLITNQVTGASAIARLAGLARHARVGVCVDDRGNVDALAVAAQAAGSQLNVLVEIDVGGARCGVAPGVAAVALAQHIAAAAPALAFGGLQAYHGSAQHIRTWSERQTAIGAAHDATRATVDALAAVGLSCHTIGGAGTGTFEFEAASGLWNELQPGSYIFLDADYARNRMADGDWFAGFDHALFVLATVISNSGAGRAVVDAGHKGLGNDQGFPTVWQRSDLSYARPSDEHGVLTLSDAADGTSSLPDVGARLLLVPGHCDPTVNLYPRMIGVRGLHCGAARIEITWPIAGRRG